MLRLTLLKRWLEQPPRPRALVLWVAIRFLRNHDLPPMEEGLSLYLELRNAPTDGYCLAGEHCVHYDSGNRRSHNQISKSLL